MTPSVRRMLYAAIAVFIVGGVLAAAVVGAGDGRDPAESNVAAGSTTTTAALSMPGEGGAPAASGEAAPAATDPATTGGAPVAGSPATSAPRSASRSAGSAPASTPPAAAAGGPFADLGPAADGGTVMVPRTGLYRYAVTRNNEKAEGTTKVEDKGAAADGTRNLVLTIAGQGFDSTNDVRWGSAEVKVAKSVMNLGGKQYECDWEPDYVELKLPLTKGATWESTSSCTITGIGPAPMTITRTTTNKVADARRVRVAGAEIPVWLITGTEKIEAAGRAQEATTTQWFSGQHGMIVRSESQSSEGKVELEIQNLDPA